MDMKKQLFIKKDFYSGFMRHRPNYPMCTLRK